MPKLDNDVVDIDCESVENFRVLVCNAVQTRINGIASTDDRSKVKTSFLVRWNAEKIGCFRLDVRTQNRKIVETHIWSLEASMLGVEIDTQSASGTSFFFAGLVSGGDNF